MEGSHYPEEMREALKPGVTRVSFPYFMSEEAVQFVIEAVKMTARDGWKLLPQVHICHTMNSTFSIRGYMNLSSSICFSSTTSFQRRGHFATVVGLVLTAQAVT